MSVNGGTVIYNLTKGVAGQAMNIRMGWNERLGLDFSDLCPI